MKRHFLFSLFLITAFSSGDVFAFGAKKGKGAAQTVQDRFVQFAEVDIDYNRLSCQKPDVFFEALLSRIDPSKLKRCFEYGYRLMTSHNTALRKEYDKLRALYGENFRKLIDLYVRLRFNKGERPHFDGQVVGFEKIGENDSDIDELRSVLRAFVLPDPHPSEAAWLNMEGCFSQRFIGNRQAHAVQTTTKKKTLLKKLEAGVTDYINAYNKVRKGHPNDKERAEELLHNIVLKLQIQQVLAKEVHDMHAAQTAEKQLEYFQPLLTAMDQTN